MKVSQIVTVIDITNRYRQQIKACKNELNWELISTGESEKADWLRKEIKEQETALGKFLDCEV